MDKSFILLSELDESQGRAIHREHRAGKLHRIDKGIYTNRPKSEWSELIKRNRNAILASRFPDCVVGFSTAFNSYPRNVNTVYITGSNNSKHTIYDLNVIVSRGAKRIKGDIPLGSNSKGKSIYIASTPRALLENLVAVRSDKNKAVGKEVIEGYLSKLLLSSGQKHIINLLEQSELIAPELGLTKEQKQLATIVDSILQKDSGRLTHPLAIAITQGEPYDEDRLKSFEKMIDDYFLFEKKWEVDRVLDASSACPSAEFNMAFLESYFSNYIEGTKFSLADALNITQTRTPSKNRPKDSHDILGVYELAYSNLLRSTPLPKTHSFADSLAARHLEMLKNRPEINPGIFKSEINYAGNTMFVRPELVRGTLQRAAKLAKHLPEGFARGVYMMLMIAEVHPFSDGNGRLARLAMNSELSSVGEQRIIIPTLAREEYVDCMKCFSTQNDAIALFTFASKMQKWSASFDYSDLDNVISNMQNCNAFEERRAAYVLHFPEKARQIMQNTPASPSMR